jgi:hypothetical protein
LFGIIKAGAVGLLAGVIAVATAVVFVAVTELLGVTLALGVGALLGPGLSSAHAVAILHSAPKTIAAIILRSLFI